MDAASAFFVGAFCGAFLGVAVMTIISVCIVRQYDWTPKTKPQTTTPPSG